MDANLLRQMDYALSRCGRPMAPPGFSSVYIPEGFLLQTEFPVSPSNLNQVLTKQITGDVPWCFRSLQITSTAFTALMLQLQLPDGRFLENDLENVTRLAGYGSWRRVLSREIPCPVGTKISITLLDITPTIAQPIAILCEGAYNYLLPSQAKPRDLIQVASALPRYVPGENQNILAPPAMWGQGPITPDGFEDELYTYASPIVTQDCAATVLAQTTLIQINRTLKFEGRRLMFLVIGDWGATGTFLIRPRVNSGYALCDDYFNAANLIGGAPWAHDWDLRTQDQVLFDVQLVDITPGSTGKMYLQIYLEGVKRKTA